MLKLLGCGLIYLWPARVYSTGTMCLESHFSGVGTRMGYRYSIVSGMVKLSLEQILAVLI
jgi:hypothetical protein